MVLNPRSQSALEYMMTYGWAILIIVIVAAVLYSFGIFSPSSSISATITGFSGAGVTAASCINSVNNQILALSITDNTGYLINITSINTTSTNGVSASQSIGSELSPGSSAVFYVNAGCNKSSSAYSGSATITYTEPGQPLPGPYLSNGKIANVHVTVNTNLVANFSNTSQIQTSHGYPAYSALTISFWVNMHNLDNNLGQYFQISAYNPSLLNTCCNWRVGFVTDGVFFDPGLWGDKEFGSSASYNKWYMVTMVLQNRSGGLENLYWIYIDGAPLNSGVASPGTSDIGIPPVSYLDFGEGPGSVPSVNGMISNVQIYDSNFSSNKISTLYSEGIGSAPFSASGLVGWWPLDGNANDYSGNNNNGVSYNVQWVSP